LSTDSNTTLRLGVEISASLALGIRRALLRVMKSSILLLTLAACGGSEAMLDTAEDELRAELSAGLARIEVIQVYRHMAYSLDGRGITVLGYDRAAQKLFEITQDRTLVEVLDPAITGAVERCNTVFDREGAPERGRVLFGAAGRCAIATCSELAAARQAEQLGCFSDVAGARDANLFSRAYAVPTSDCAVCAISVD
jgi:hypothetical protein